MIEHPGTAVGPLGEKMGIEVTELTPERVVGTMPVEGNTQPFGSLHGGASAVLAEQLGSMLGNLHAGPGRYVVGVDLNATHHRAVRSGTVTGVATPLHVGGTVAVLDVEIRDDEGRRVCTSRLTCMFRDA